MNQLTEVIRLAAEIGLDGFDFDRIVRLVLPKI